MIPKEKAEELVDKMYFSRRYIEEENYIPQQAWVHAKQCALIAVDEIIEQNNICIKHTGKGTNNYWQEVKQEIVKI